MSDRLSQNHRLKTGSGEKMIRISGIIEESIVDGPGLRFVVFTQGCVHNCKGCHNPETHSLEGGKLIGTSEIVKAYKNSGAAGITISGGEPFLQGEALAFLGEEIHKLGGNVITYTGYTHMELIKLQMNTPSVKKLLQETDLLVDGPFILDERTVDRPFIGSANQKIISLSKRGDSLLHLIRA